MARNRIASLTNPTLEVDPLTIDCDYSAAERVIMEAIHAYKQSSGQVVLTWSEVLEVLEGLGHRKAV